jgi:hypothetical protein
MAGGLYAWYQHSQNNNPMYSTLNALALEIPNGRGEGNLPLSPKTVALAWWLPFGGGAEPKKRGRLFNV